jgi:hypothetical protein
MKKEFVPYQEALALKQLGFDEPCFGYYKDGRIAGVNKWDREDWGFHVITNKDITNVTSEIVIAPLFQQAFRWFREKYGLAYQFQYYHVPKWTFQILEFTDIKVTPNILFSETNKVFTYEEAELACLDKLIEIIKAK